MTTLPERLARTIVELYGAAGEQWLRDLPTLLEECARRWGLDISCAEQLTSFEC